MRFLWLGKHFVDDRYPLVQVVKTRRIRYVVNQQNSLQTKLHRKASLYYFNPMHWAKEIQLTTTTANTTPFNGLVSRTIWVSRYQNGYTSLDLNEARDDGVFGCSGISWNICKQSAPRSRQITTPTSYHSIFAGQMLFLMPNQQCQSTKNTRKEVN